jgi:hypothetical protein
MLSLNDVLELNDLRTLRFFSSLLADCTKDKDGFLTVSAVVTDKMDILFRWKYSLESCDRGFRVYWSHKGPVDANSSSKILSLNNTSYEITDLGNHIR